MNDLIVGLLGREVEREIEDAFARAAEDFRRNPSAMRYLSMTEAAQDHQHLSYVSPAILRAIVEQNNTLESRVGAVRMHRRES